MIEHLINSALDSFKIQCKHGQHDQTHMAYTGIGNQGFDVFLNEGHQSAVYDSDQTEYSQIGKKFSKSVRKKRNSKT